MPLPPPEKRSLVHAGALNAGYRRDDGLWDIEGSLVDTRTEEMATFGRGKIAWRTSPRNVAADDRRFRSHRSRRSTPEPVHAPYPPCPNFSRSFRQSSSVSVYEPGWTARCACCLGLGLHPPGRIAGASRDHRSADGICPARRDWRTPGGQRRAATGFHKLPPYARGTAPRWSMCCGRHRTTTTEPPCRIPATMQAGDAAVQTETRRATQGISVKAGYLAVETHQGRPGLVRLTLTPIHPHVGTAAGRPASSICCAFQ